jgi:DNA-binding transcriptional LysR family regulator
MNISLRQLRVFIGVAESFNFTKTAQRLHLSQAALSATVRELEAQLDCRLFDRTTRTVQLTGAGLAFLPTAQLVTRELETAALRLREIGRKDISYLRIGVTPMIAAHVMPDVLDAFKLQVPSVVVDVVDAGPIDLQRGVESGEIDAAFGAFFSQASGLHNHAVMQWRLLVVSSQAQRDLPVPFRWSDLAMHPLIGLHAMSPVQQVVEGHLAEEQVTPQSRTTVNHLETQIALAERGFGLAVIPSFAAVACRRYNVRLRPISPGGNHDYSQIVRAGRAHIPSLDVLAQIMARTIETASAVLVGADVDRGASSSTLP